MAATTTFALYKLKRQLLCSFCKERRVGYRLEALTINYGAKKWSKILCYHCVRSLWVCMDKT